MLGTNTLTNIGTSNPNGGNVPMNNYNFSNCADATSDDQLVTLRAIKGSYMPAGIIMAWPSATLPQGWLKCDGSTYSAVTFPQLYAVLGVTYTPNLCGYFLRCIDPTGLVDIDGGSSRALLSSQGSANQNHTHTLYSTNYCSNSSEKVLNTVSDTNTSVGLAYT